jgi:hypothetical protein
MANTKAIGVAYRDQEINGGTVDNTPIGATTPSAGAFTTLSSSGATSLGDAAADVIGFHGAAGAAQATFVAPQSIAALSVSGVVGFTSSTSLSSLVEKVNAILTLLSDKGLMAAS